MLGLFAAEPVLSNPASAELGEEPDGTVKAHKPTKEKCIAHTFAITKNRKELQASTTQACKFATGGGIVTCMSDVWGGAGWSFCRTLNDTNLALILRFLNSVMSVFPFPWRGK